MRVSAFLISLAIAGMPSTALAWGDEGHKIVALVAAANLTSCASEHVQVLLGDDVPSKMSDAATWADHIRRRCPRTARWHYVDIEVGSRGYDAARDCPDDDCIVAQVQKDSEIIADTSVASPTRADALRFLIHFVGDLHQPLHSADNHDRGGNEIHVILNGRTENLHKVWDKEIVETLGSDPGAIAASLQRQTTLREKAKWERGSVTDWANQSFRVAQVKVYGPISGASGDGAPISLPPDYAQRNSHIVSLQLERAGFRLAALLNRAFGRTPCRSNSKMLKSAVER